MNEENKKSSYSPHSLLTQREKHILFLQRRPDNAERNPGWYTIFVGGVKAHNPQQKISFDTIITVFLRTFLATFGGAVGAYLFVAAGHYLRIPNSSVVFYAFPILCLMSGIWYISYAKKKLGNHWGIGVSGIFGILAVFILLSFVLGTSS